MRTRYLGYAVIATFVVGILFVSVPFVGSLKPSEKANALVGARRLDIADFERNSYRIVHVTESRLEESSQSTTYHSGMSWLVIRDDLGQFFVYWLPMWEGAIIMPRTVWGQMEGLCRDLGLPKAVTTTTEQTLIQCNEPDEAYMWFAEYWYWTLDGKNVSRELPDLTPIRSQVEGDELAIYYPFSS